MWGQQGQGWGTLSLWWQAAGSKGAWLVLALRDTNKEGMRSTGTLVCSNGIYSSLKEADFVAPFFSKSHSIDQLFVLFLFVLLLFLKEKGINSVSRLNSAN